MEIYRLSLAACNACNVCSLLSVGRNSVHALTNCTPCREHVALLARFMFRCRRLFPHTSAEAASSSHVVCLMMNTYNILSLLAVDQRAYHLATPVWTHSCCWRLHHFLRFSTYAVTQLTRLARHSTPNWMPPIVYIFLAESRA